MFLINNLLVPSYGDIFVILIVTSILAGFWLFGSESTTLVSLYDVSCASERVVGLRAINAGADLILDCRFM